MPEMIIRQVEGEELVNVRYWLGAYAFTATPPLPNAEEWAERLRSRPSVTSFAVYEDDKALVTVSSAPLNQNVRGSIYRASGVFGVASHPSARRKGYTRRALAALLAATRADGQAFSDLYPFRDSFYERLGYVSFPIARTIHFNTRGLQALLKKELPGQVELLPFNENFDLYLNYLRQEHLPRVHGWAQFEAPNRFMLGKMTRWLAVARLEDKIAGMMLYETKGDTIAEYHFLCRSFFTSNAAGRYLLLEWIARHIDQTTTAEITLPPYDFPETWLSDLELKGSLASRAPMGRVVDVAAIGGLQTGPGQFSAHISDPLCPWNEGCWQFTSQDGRLVVNRAESPACELNIQGLSALVYGCQDPESFSIRGWGNPGPELQNTLRSMFPAQIPYLFEEF
jgi:predicted acetyltransferase